MASWRVLRRTLCTAAETAAAPVPGSRWERLKKSKVGVWCRGLFTDYKEACREVVVGSWERPIKASIYASLLGGTWACFYTRPDQLAFEATLLDCSGQLGLLSPWIRNGTSDGHVQSLGKLRNEGRLRVLSLGILALAYQADYDPDATLYEAQCSNLSVPWRELHERVLDVGFVGRWWVLQSKMKDYDVNEEQFKGLPADMQATSAPSVQEVETSERLHKESWLPLTVEEEEEEETETNVTDRKEEESQIQALKEEQIQA
ncbi:mitochondrial import inner membrane translocase subunit Tim29 [Trematomus bernacchii]|uniref:mitochondrial import inner membrane translocase subunit Tim29 n=1 Tax=Trematomus bernacchii TaxID=40690 RepID=UPI00146F6DE0|nr:mitochondrial import inner membrane translocase subunit Tim29 [Trematomus bernacchii]